MGEEVIESTADKIRHRLIKAKKRFYACDNIADYILPGELLLLKDQLADEFHRVLKALVIDTSEDPNSRDTANRLADMYVDELLSGRYQNTPKCTAFPNDTHDRYNGMLVVRAEIKSVCSHHLQSVRGVAYIGIIPTEKVIGLSKYIRIAQWHARRGTLQEELCNRIAVSIMQVTESKNVAVYIAARHGCCENRGVEAHSSLTQTTVLHGEFHNADVKKEFFDNIALQQSYGEKI